MSTRLVAQQVSPETMDLVPAPARREWMEQTHHRFANRCLPLLMANQSGWFVTTRTGVRAVWDGGAAQDALRVESLAEDTDPPAHSHFGSGVLTWNLPWLFRTDPGWNLLVRGPANWPKDGAVPLEGLVETDWTVATFTVNWLMTRPGVPIVFEPGEPICMLVPHLRNDLETVEPAVGLIDDGDSAAYEAWRTSRQAFNESLRTGPPRPLAEQWQRDYFQGTTPAAVAAGHQRRRTLRPFAPQPAPSPEPATPLALLPFLRRHADRLKPDTVLAADQDIPAWSLIVRELSSAAALHPAGTWRILASSTWDLVHLGHLTTGEQARLELALERAAYVTVVVPSRGTDSTDIVDLVTAGVLDHAVDGDSGTAVALLSRTDPAGLGSGSRAAGDSVLWSGYPAGEGESRCGPGSSLEQTTGLRRQLPPLLARLGVRSVLDAPCGDGLWMSAVELGDVDYLGVDMSDELLAVARSALAGARQRVLRLDLLHDAVPTADLILCRDLLVHLPYRDALRLLAGFAASGATWLLTTTFPDRTWNEDVILGDWRPLNLTLPPFDLPPPVEVLVEGCTEGDGGYADKSLGLWKLPL